MSVRPYGDRAFLVELEQRIDASIVDVARAIADVWEARGLGEAIPAYASVVLTFDPARVPWKEASAITRDLAASPPPPTASVAGRLIEVPTVYDGPDLADTAARSGLSIEELVALHGGREYHAGVRCTVARKKTQSFLYRSRRVRTPSGGWRCKKQWRLSGPSEGT